MRTVLGSLGLVFIGGALIAMKNRLMTMDCWEKFSVAFF